MFTHTFYRFSAVLTVFTGLAVAGPITTGVWYEFSFTTPGVGALGCSPADPAGSVCTPSSGTPATFLDAPPWTITLAEAGFLKVTDAFLSGDSFEILNFGVPIGMTPIVAAGKSCGSDPVPCFADPSMSHAVFPLAAGSHSFTIAAVTTVATGAAYFIVETAAVPEPGTGLLALAGIAGLVLGRRSFRP